jgi:hypothetical protein
LRLHDDLGAEATHMQRLQTVEVDATGGRRRPTKPGAVGGARIQVTLGQPPVRPP